MISKKYMPTKIIVLSFVVITVLIGGSIIALKVFNKPAEPNMISAVIKANNVADKLVVPYNDSVQLSWESNNAVHCEISGDWLGIVPASGSQLIGTITEARNYSLLCVNEKKETALSSVAVYIDEKTIPANATSTASNINRESFRDFTYTWKKNLCSDLRNDPDVAALQTILYLETLLPSSDQITGNFDDQTSVTLKKFQELYDIEQTGCAGTKTISKLNELYGAKVPAYSSAPSTNFGGGAVKSPTPTSNAYSPQNILQNIISYPTKLIEKIADYISTEIIVDLKANNSDGPITIPYNGEATLSWTSKNAQLCKGFGAWSGNKPLNGSISTGPLTSSKYYTLTCDGSNGAKSDSIFIKIPYSASGSSYGSGSYYGSGSTNPNADNSSVENTATSTDAFGGMVTNVHNCYNPSKNSSILVSGKDGGRFIWVMGESQLQCVLISKGSCPYTIPETGMWLLGELGGEVKCNGAGGPGKKIIYAGYGFNK